VQVVDVQRWRPTGVWVQLRALGADGTTCEDASWATMCESRLNSKLAWPISVSNLLDVPHALQPAERERLLDHNQQTILVGARRFVDGLPVCELSNIYYRRTSLVK
jgi:hypothetical protein